MSVQEYPWIHLRRNYAAKTGNDRFEGFCVDLLKLIAQQVDFTYEILPVSDNMAGIMSPNRSWSGVMKQIVSGVNELSFLSLRHRVMAAIILATVMSNISIHQSG